jgi:hypothetical protein
MNNYDNNNPVCLYHYTSLENLALILESKKIRFSRLDKIDDLNEGVTSDQGQLGMYHFVSCWTDISEESIPFWNMYTPKMRGVRIKMPLDMFQLYEVQGNPDNGMYVDTSHGKFSSLIPQSEMHGQDHILSPTNIGEFLLKIEYTGDESLIRPCVSSSLNTVGLGQLGKYKKLVWSFQSEWRYRVIALPMASPPADGKYNNPDYAERVSYYAMKNFSERRMSRECVYGTIRNDAFENMEVLLGPKHNESDKLILSALANQYNPEAKISISSLSGQIR